MVSAAESVTSSGSGLPRRASWTRLARHTTVAREDRRLERTRVARRIGCRRQGRGQAIEQGREVGRVGPQPNGLVGVLAADTAGCAKAALPIVDQDVGEPSDKK